MKLPVRVGETPEPGGFTETDLQFLEIFSRDVAAALNTGLAIVGVTLLIRAPTAAAVAFGRRPMAWHSWR